MKKRLISAITAIMTMMSAAAVNAYAEALPFINSDSAEYRDIVDGGEYVKLEKYSEWYNNSEFSAYEKGDIYFNGRIMKKLVDHGIQFDIVVPLSSNSAFITDFLESKRSGFAYSLNSFKRTNNGTGKTMYYKRLSVVDRSADKETFAIAAELSGMLRDIYDDCSVSYYGHRFTPYPIYPAIVGKVVYSVQYLDEHKVSHNDIADFLADNGYNVTFGSGTDENLGDYYEIVPTSDMSFDDMLMAAVVVYEKFGVFYQTGATETSAVCYDVNVIEMADTVLGDANCDGEVTIADSTAILQSIGSPDKYALTPQGSFNADVCGGHDGVSAMDALEIQRFDAKMINKF